MEIFKQMEKSIKAATTCDELDQAVENMIEQALTLEKEYTEEEKFVHQHVKPKYDQGCIFMYQLI